MRLIPRILSLAACGAALMAFTAAADARPRKRIVYIDDETVIVVKPRSWLEPGNVPIYSGPRPNVQQMTLFNYQPLERYSPGVLWKPEPVFR